MRTFRFIGMALVAMLMCVNFTACSSDNDEPTKNDDGIITNQKKLVEFKITYDSETMTNEFSYDSKGRLASAIHTEKYGGNTHRSVTNYTWGTNIIIEENGESTYTYSLNDGLIRTIRYKRNSDWNNTSFTYNSSKQLLTVEEIQKQDTYIQTYTWENGKITKSIYSENNSYKNEESIYEYTYSGKTCKGYFPLSGDAVDDALLFYAHPELISLRTTQLPSEINSKDDYNETTEKYTYTLDKDGYVESCTMIYTEKRLSDNTTNTDTSIYTFKWE